MDYLPERAGLKTMSINSTTIAVKNVESAISIINDADFKDIELLDNDVAVTLQETTFQLCDNVDKYLSVLLGAKPKTNMGTVTEVTIDSLIADLEHCKNILLRTDAFGVSRVSVKFMSTVRKQSESVKESALNIMIESIKYKARN